MENATKALLIAAAVLVAIILIAFGIRIFNSSSGVSEQAKTIGKDINSQSKIATSSAISSIDSDSTNLIGKEYTVEEFNNEIFRIIGTGNNVTWNTTSQYKYVNVNLSKSNLNVLNMR